MKILITGASGGIGSALAKHLIKKHAIIAVAYDKKKLQASKKNFDSYTESSNLDIFALDISDLSSMKRFSTKFKEPLDVLINCAGVLTPVGKLLDNDLKVWKHNIEINLFGTVQMCYYMISHLLKSRHGKIINFSGGGSAYPRSFHTAYASSKAAVVRFTETLAQEYPSLDINVIAPGAHKTGMWADETHDDEPQNWGDQEQLLKFIDYLISEKSDGITGRFIHYKDDWNKFNPEKMSKDIYTLRRIEK
ncbi:hypothetical protein A3J15_02125 [Candidatus Roizmanbacteria bacterium RIFCSPLOWO2_02_FULL_38_10]|uniref:Short-chain dehydrogenase n=1 Tax=Candidatus Roizmanbacteria bacterium RIFCSPLOWO2_02_FULL_38_10 TaxID=1802074 RepID=A0A1F7JLF9_9BACT|nr:MAG: hypothetical protein A3J15_02125 [Candidatus Roizmanbacteria bacterium RIFCSPLOWO2_02_FULL_38_10]